MINSTNYPEKSPEWVLAKFLGAWEKRNWKAMLKYCQISWRTMRTDMEKSLFSQFRHKLLSAKILKTEKISDVTTDISVEIYYKDINIKRRIRRKARLICELGPMQPSPGGTYGVNPTSMIKARR